MRRAIWAAVIGVIVAESVARGGGWSGPRSSYPVYYSGHHRCPYGYKTWGYHQLPGPYLQSSYSRSFGPMTAPGEYIYAGSMGVPRGSTTEPLERK
jgi:hypothetical protein